MGLLNSEFWRKVFALTFSMTLGVVFFQGSDHSALADETTNSILERLEKIEREAGENTIAQKLGLSLYGYVEASYTQNFNNPSDNKNALRIFDVDANSFRTHMAQVVLEREGKTGGSMADRGGFRIKLDYGEDAKLTGGSGTDDFDYQEAYVQFIAPIGNGIDLKIGRMNTLIGYEVIESPYNPNFSRSWLFGFGEPFTTTGIRASYGFNDMVHVSVGAINDWTGTTSDTNRSKSVEGLLAIAPMDNVGLSIFGFWGSEGTIGTDDSERVQVGGIVDVQVTDAAQVVMEGYYGNFSNVTTFNPSGNARWNGYAGYLIYDFTDKWGVRLRGEVFQDAAGFFTGTAQELWEVTSTLQFKPIPSIITRAEFRYDKSDETPFLYGTRAANHQETLAIEAIYLF